MSDRDEKNMSALELHEKMKGKIEINNKIALKDRELLSKVYTPGVGEVVEAISKNEKLANKLTLKNNFVAIVSDGSAVLGYGKVGAKAAIPVMEGKAMLFKEFAGINAFPICIEEQDPDKVVEIVKAISPVFGAINLEDIAAPKCFYIEERLQKELDIPVFHDDQHATAIVVLAGLINALKLAGKGKDVKIVVNGAGAAGIAITHLLLEYGFKNILLLDSKGIVCKSREDLNEYKRYYAEKLNINDCGNLEYAIKGADVFIGVSKGGVLSKDMVKNMADKPIIFAIANPVPEIMPEDAKEAGAYIVATGRSDYPNQINNALVFPNLFKAFLEYGVKNPTDKIKIKVAENIAKILGDEVDRENIIPGIYHPKLPEAIMQGVKEGVQ